MRLHLTMHRTYQTIGPLSDFWAEWCRPIALGVSVSQAECRPIGLRLSNVYRTSIVRESDSPIEVRQSESDRPILRPGV